jgi:2-amino-4-hydroxy-6-hydroxymethyldihydropteridine diphosphokinase
MSTVFLLLGSNLNQRWDYIQNALSHIGELPSTHVVSASSVYETEPWGLKEQSDFLNCVIRVDTALAPEELLKETKRIESELGRSSRQKYGPREIDIDILYYDTLNLQSETLVLPHTHIAERRFVLVPMNEIAPDVTDLVAGKTIRALLAECTDTGRVTVTNKKLNIHQPHDRHSHVESSL